MAKARFEFPDIGDRTTINGMTGSGKSTFALWMIAETGYFQRQPWFFIDYKGEKIIEALEKQGDVSRLKLDPKMKLPKQPGLYVVSPDPRDSDPIVDFLWKLWELENCGVFFDELNLVPEQMSPKGAIKALLTTGRSKRISVYSLTQRPVDVNLHVYSEATQTAIFKLRSKDDYLKAMSYIPEGQHENSIWFKPWLKNLPPHWCRWYDTRGDISITLKPSPDAKFILDLFARKVDEMERRKSV